MVRVGDDALQIWQELLAYHRRTLDELDAELVAEASMRLEQYDVLYQLARAGIPLRMGQIAEATLIAPSSCTRIVGGLVAGGLVSRTADAGDRRVVRIELTPAGRRAQRRAAAIHLRGIARLFADRLDERSLTELGAALARLRGDALLADRPTRDRRSGGRPRPDRTVPRSRPAAG